MAAGVRRLTSLRLAMDDLTIGFDPDKQLYYVEGGPVTNRGKVYLTKEQWTRMGYLVSALRREELASQCECS